ncbi:MAG: bifunctional transaldolase/phosoglucose isomerase [Nitrospirae bacterium]|nr:MAG: bifunctional transaldolase/phosoglucose isomerase [Nitrospirota bacterium]
MNRLVQLREFGQSPWFDFISRRLIESRELQRMIEQDGLMGITSNPSIFEKAIAGSTDYDRHLASLASEGASVAKIYEALVVRDIQDAADLLRPVYESTQARDGYVSLEVSPHLAFDTEGTIEEAVRLRELVDRPNVMIKVPGTPQGLPAIEHLVGMGLNINVTLLFSVEVYEQVARAYIRGIRRWLEQGGNAQAVASVASFFVSRIDTLVDRRLEALLETTADPVRRAHLDQLRGRAAIANAKQAYRRFQTIFGSPEFAELKAQGVQVQRVLWASTGTKNPRYPETYYVDHLIGPDTVNTMPEATWVAFRDHGTLAPTLLQGLEESERVLHQLAEVGIHMTEVAEQLLVDGAKLFADSFDRLMGAINRKREAALGDRLDRQFYALGSYAEAVETTVRELREQNTVRRLWARDASLWHQDPAHQAIIRQSLGWLTIIESQLEAVDHIKAFADTIRQAGYRHVVLLGMGGSSLCPEVCRMTFGVIPGFPELHVLDSTVPAQIRAVESRVDLSKTLCIVASKSGSTIEPLMFHKYFFDRVQRVVGDRVGDHFVAITDPGSFMETLAREQRFRAIFPGVPEIGGRYSALSNFGMVPAAVMGVDIELLLRRALHMRWSCDACVPPSDNPGAKLGATLGSLARAGRDKLTVVSSPRLWDVGAWLEQLIAESTGKEGTGIVPVDDEPLGIPDVYGSDRTFVYLRDVQHVDPRQEATMKALEAAGHPVVTIAVEALVNLGQEFFLWEIATALAGAILGINAFDQPNVQESKDRTKALLQEYVRTGRLPEDDPAFVEEPLRLYADAANRAALQGARTMEEMLATHLARAQPGDYVAINAYLERTPAIHDQLQRLRSRIRDAKRVATTVGYGPRFLHSTGQLHKGGPNSGVFLQLTCDDPEDLPIPGEPYTFGVLKAAQALGDLQSLVSRGRRVIRVHLGSDVGKGLARLEEALSGGLMAGRV